MQLLPVFRYKYTSKADTKSRGLHNFCEMLLVFEDHEARNRMRNKSDIEMLTNACFLALNHAEGLISVEQSIKSKTSQVISSGNKAVIMLDYPVNRSKASDMQIKEPLFQFCHSLPILVAIKTSQWNCCLVNMANILDIIGDTNCEDFFRMNIDINIGHGFTESCSKMTGNDSAKIQIYFISYKLS